MLQKFLILLKKSPLVRDNLILFVGIFLSGIAGFVYHFVMGRFLGPEGYGVLGVLLSIIYIFLIILNSYQMSIAKFTSRLIVDKEQHKLSYLFYSLRKTYLLVAFILALLFILLAPMLSTYLHISRTLLYLVALFPIFIFLLALVRGIMQGSQHFVGLSINHILTEFSKLLFGVLFIYLGYNVFGALAGILVAFIVAFFIGFRTVRPLLRTTPQAFSLRSLHSYGLSLTLAITSLTLFYTVDVILVKHFFDSVQAGYYAALALLGKVLFFGSSSIGQVMFPKVSVLVHQKKPHKHLLYKSSGLALIFIFPVLFCYFAFPNLVVRTLFGAQFLEIAPLLGLFGIYMTLFCFIYLLTYYFVSLDTKKCPQCGNKNFIQKEKNIVCKECNMIIADDIIKRSRFSTAQFLGLLFFFNFLQIYLLYNFHESLTQVITIMISLSLIYLIILYGLFTRIHDA